jgi:hypothetical protein
MPTHQNAIDSNKFWTAPESDIFPLPVVAIALGIGRNKMCQIPVARIMIAKRACYRKSDILNWALAEQAKGGDNLLLKLRAENSSIGRYERAWSRAYDQSPYYGVSGADERKDKHALAKRLHKELQELDRVLTYTSMLTNGIEDKRGLAVSNYKQLANLRGYERWASEFESCWWLIDDFRERQKARIKKDKLANEICDKLELLGMFDTISDEEFDSLFKMSESDRNQYFANLSST